MEPNSPLKTPEYQEYGKNIHEAWNRLYVIATCNPSTSEVSVSREDLHRVVIALSDWSEMANGLMSVEGKRYERSTPEALRRFFHSLLPILIDPQRDEKPQPRDSRPAEGARSPWPAGKEILSSTKCDALETANIGKPFKNFEECTNELRVVRGWGLGLSAIACIQQLWKVQKGPFHKMTDYAMQTGFLGVLPGNHRVMPGPADNEGCHYYCEVEDVWRDVPEFKA